MGTQSRAAHAGDIPQAHGATEHGKRTLNPFKAGWGPPNLGTAMWKPKVKPKDKGSLQSEAFFSL